VKSRRPPPSPHATPTVATPTVAATPSPPTCMANQLELVGVFNDRAMNAANDTSYCSVSGGTLSDVLHLHGKTHDCLLYLSVIGYHGSGVTYVGVTVAVREYVTGALWHSMPGGIVRVTGVDGRSGSVKAALAYVGGEPTRSRSNRSCSCRCRRAGLRSQPTLPGPILGGVATGSRQGSGPRGAAPPGRCLSLVESRRERTQQATQHPVAEGHDHPSILPDDGSGERGAAPIEREPDCRHPQAGTRFPGQSPGKRCESAGLTPYEPLPIVAGPMISIV
jgi:hypothetical protein